MLDLVFVLNHWCSGNVMGIVLKINNLHKSLSLPDFINTFCNIWFYFFSNFTHSLWLFSLRYRPPTFHVQAWYDEVRDFSYPYEHECNPYCPFRCSGPVCTHYTQVCFGYITPHFSKLSLCNCSRIYTTEFTYWTWMSFLVNLVWLLKKDIDVCRIGLSISIKDKSNY